MHSPLERVYTVGERVETIGVEAGVPLEGHLDLLAVLLALDVAYLGEQRLLGGVDVSHEVPDTALVAVVDLLVVISFPFVAEPDP